MCIIKLWRSGISLCLAAGLFSKNTPLHTIGAGTMIQEKFGIISLVVISVTVSYNSQALNHDTISRQKVSDTVK